MSRSRREEADDAVRHATWVGVQGAGIWGCYSAAASGLLYMASPIYRGLTIQFKLYIFMSGTLLGGMLWADKGLREYERAMQRKRKAERLKHNSSLEDR